MEPLLIELLLITLTVCASSSSHPLESTQSPLGDTKNSSLILPKSLQSEEIRLNITLKSDENEKENVDIDMGKYHMKKIFLRIGNAAPPLRWTTIMKRMFLCCRPFFWDFFLSLTLYQSCFFPLLLPKRGDEPEAINMLI